MYFGPARRDRPMRYRKRTNDFVASNVSFNPDLMWATSYGWWYFVKHIGGKVVFNDYRYSPSTQRHQSKVERVMQSLGIKVDLRIEAPKGLQDLESALGFYEESINKLMTAIRNPRTRKEKNAERAKQVRELQARAKEVRKLLKYANV